MMFAPFCPTHDSTVLMTRRNVVSFHNGPDGPIIHWRCNCGHEGVLGRTGSVAAASVTSSPAAMTVTAMTATGNCNA